MKLRYLICVAVAAANLALPAAADDKDPFDKFESALNPEVLFRGVIREDDVSLLFRHIRESIAASARGEEARPSEELTRRSEAISREMAVRGSLLAGALLDAFEAAARQAVREEFGLGALRAPRRREPPFPRSTID